MKNATSSLGSARPSDYELSSSSSSSSSHLFSDSDIENITKEEKEEEEEKEESIDDNFLYEEFMVPSEVIVPSEVASVPKIPEIIKSHHQHEPSTSTDSVCCWSFWDRFAIIHRTLDTTRATAATAATNNSEIMSGNFVMWNILNDNNNGSTTSNV
jgi:hypothetical protein